MFEILLQVKVKAKRVTRERKAKRLEKQETCWQQRYDTL